MGHPPNIQPLPAHAGNPFSEQLSSLKEARASLQEILDTQPQSRIAERPKASPKAWQSHPFILKLPEQATQSIF
jgi:hypothetical protein